MTKTERLVGRWPGELATYALVAVVLTWPLASALTRALPLGAESTPIVPLFSLWNLWWNTDRLAHFGANYFQAPIFYPHRDALAFSEPLIAQAWAIAPLLWVTKKPVLAYNMVLLVTLVLNGVSAGRLLRSWRVPAWIALIGGLFVEALPFVHAELGVLPLSALFAPIWTFHALHRLARHPGYRRALVLGVVLGLCYLTCNQYGLFVSLLLLVSGAWLFGRKLAQSRVWACLGLAIALALLFIAPLALVQRRVAAHEGLERRLAVVERLSAVPSRFIKPTWPVFGRVRGAAEENAHHGYFIGPFKSALAVLALLSTRKRQQRRRFVLFCASVLGSSFLLAQGAHLRLGSWVPYAALARMYPGFSQVRSVFRFAIFAELSLALLAALGLLALTSGWRAAWRSTRAQRWRPIVCAAVTVLALIEVLPPAQKLYIPPGTASRPEWVAWLVSHTTPRTPLACLPMAAGGKVGQFERTAEWQYFQMQHERPLINGYSSYFPRDIAPLALTLARLPSAESLVALRRLGVGIVLIDRRASNPLPDRDVIERSHELELAFEDPQFGVELYRVR